MSDLHIVVNTTTGQAQKLKGEKSYWNTFSNSERLLKSLAKKAKKNNTCDSYVVAQLIKMHWGDYAEFSEDGMYLVIDAITWKAWSVKGRFCMMRDDADRIINMLSLGQETLPPPPYALVRVVTMFNLEVDIV